MRALSTRFHDAAMVAIALLISAHAVLSVNSLGDYAGDAGPAIRALLRGDPHAFAQARPAPAMGDFSLLLRAPFAVIAYIGRPTELNIYRWGVLPCMLSLAALALWLARIARARGMSPLASWAIMLLALVNPLVSSAINLGHPEELLTGSLCVGALVAACQRRALLTVVLLGLALACKQWSLVAILPVLLVVERHRVRTLAWALLLASAVTVPEALGAPASFLRNQIHLAGDRSTTTGNLSWWWPLVPNTTLHVLVAGSHRQLVVHRLPRAFVESLHSLIIGLDLLIAIAVARLRALPLRTDGAFALLAIVFLLRCTLDAETEPYYLEPLFLVLLAWDACSAERIPARALLAWGLSYVVFDQLAPYVAATSLAYAACTLLALLLFARTLAARFSSRLAPPTRKQLDCSAHALPETLGTA